MDLFSETANRITDVVGISAMFLQVMLFEFGLKEKKHHRWKYVNLFVFYGYTAVTIMSRTGRGVKLFASVMLLLVVIIQIVVSKKRKLEAVETIGPNRTELQLLMGSAEQVMQEDTQVLRKLAR
jgi:formate-dependent nitrite reductase membrane component NrfD